MKSQAVLVDGVGMPGESGEENVRAPAAPGRSSGARANEPGVVNVEGASHRNGSSGRSPGNLNVFLRPSITSTDLSELRRGGNGSRRAFSRAAKRRTALPPDVRQRIIPCNETMNFTDACNETMNFTDVRPRGRVAELRRGAILLGLAIASVACSGSSPTQEFTLQFASRIGAQDVECGASYDDLGTSNATLTIADMRFYIHDVFLVEDGISVPLELTSDGKWQNRNLALLDFEDGSAGCPMGTAEMNTVVQGTAPQGNYDAVSFKLGVPFDQNHTDPTTAEAPAGLMSMAWSWRAGRKFLRIDGETALPGGGGVEGWRIHLGSTGCEVDVDQVTTACANENRPSVTVTDFEPASDTIVADVSALLSESDIGEDTSSDPGCMSNPADVECAPVFRQLGLAFGTTPAAEQAFFRTE